MLFNISMHGTKTINYKTQKNQKPNTTYIIGKSTNKQNRRPLPLPNLKFNAKFLTLEIYIPPVKIGFEQYDIKY